MKPKWSAIILFIILAIGLSAPVHLAYVTNTYQSVTNGWIISDWVYLVAGIGPMAAGLLVLAFQKSISYRITILGNEHVKNILIAILPVVSFSIVGMENSKGINNHYFGLVYASINVSYAFFEEFGWRRYLQNALEGINKHLKYILIGFIWWIWHLRFNTDFDIYVFPFICIGGGYLLGKLTDTVKSIMPAVCMHSLIILLTNTGAVTTNKMIAGAIIIAGWIIIEQIYKTR